jgi:selenocysteine lyase/cysteine desulfurase
VAEKVDPAELDEESFLAVPVRLRNALARLIGASPTDVLLANSTSYTLNLIAQGLRWQAGDEVICVHGDFPATILPWLELASRGVRVELLRAEGARVDAELVASAIGPRTRVVCLSWVFSFFGHAVDLAALGGICRERGVWLVVNGSQAVGARTLDVGSAPIDALACCGWKWLCGPYATGFGWISLPLRSELDYPQPHWLRHQRSSQLDRSLEYTLLEDDSAAQFDVFASASFFNFRPFAASVEHLLAVGPEAVERHDQLLVERLLANLATTGFEVSSPQTLPERSTLVFLSDAEPARNREVHAALQAAGVEVALREGSLRVSPHLYNSSDDVDRLADVLNELRAST